MTYEEAKLELFIQPVSSNTRKEMEVILKLYPKLIVDTEEMLFKQGTKLENVTLIELYEYRESTSLKSMPLYNKVCKDILAFLYKFKLEYFLKENE